MVQTKEINKFDFKKYYAAHKVGLFFYALIYLIGGAMDICATIYFAKLVECLTVAVYDTSIRILFFLMKAQVV